MKCLSIRQPWAMLVLAGYKQFETRSWQTQYRGRLAIHAGRSLAEETVHLCQRPWLRGLLRAAGYASALDLPRGKVLGIVELVDCLALPAAGFQPTPAERLLGDFRPGKFAWRLTCPHFLPDPMQFPGQLGLFEVPDLA
jgi:hypothetical protein